jgi:alpha-tubulin suppressor-like RCC1 family protein
MGRPGPAAGLLAVTALAALVAGCSGSMVNSASTRSSGPHTPGASAPPPAQLPVVAAGKPQQAAHWGTFFGGKKGVFVTSLVPVRVTLPGRITEIGSSNSSQYALLANGTLYAWGLGTQGELGDGQKQNSATPVQVRFPAGVRIASIPVDAMPYDTGLAVDTTGHVWGWGHNHGGELCTGNHRQFLTPVRLPMQQVSALAGASNHAVYDAAGTVVACGQNVQGDLGIGSRRSTTRPVRVARLGGKKVTELFASFANSAALTSGGQYLDWGYDAQGQLGDGKVRRPSNVPVLVPLRAPVTQAAEGGSLWNNGQTLVKLADGSLWAWGDGGAFQLGNGKARNQPSPARFRSPPGVSYVRLATGSATSYAVTSTGAVYAWGISRLGQIGNGTTTVVRVPVRIVTGARLISSTADNVVVSLDGSARN